MARWAREKHMPHPKPVEKVELSESHIGIRLALVVLLLVIGISFIGLGIRSLLTVESPMASNSIMVSIGEEGAYPDTVFNNIGNEFVFMYNLGTGDMSPTAENKILRALYTDFMVDAYRVFHNNQAFENVNNLYYVNQHPNEEIEVNEMLYQALSLIKEYDDRNIYLAPVYAQYDDIFFCEDDSQIADYDPYLNPEVASVYKKLAEYAKDAKAVDVQLLGNNRMKLMVSHEYMDFCKENDITCYIDFSWMKNAFIIDSVAETLNAKGFTFGTISSYDGFSRNLDESGTEFSFNIYDVQEKSANENNVYQVATMQYTGMRSIVTMRSFPINTLDAYRYYELDNGEIRTMYLDIADGQCKSAANNLYAYSKEYSCSEILLQIAPIYIADAMKEDSLSALSEKGIETIYCKDTLIRYTEDKLQLKDLYVSDKFSYSSKLIQ